MLKAKAEIELRRRQRENTSIAVEFRGASLWLNSTPAEQLPFEIMLSGPAETGKTYAICYFLDRLLRGHKGIQVLLCRKTHKSIYTSVLRTYRKVIDGRNDITSYGGEKPEWYRYANGAQLTFAGLDNPDKILSSEYDVIYVNQAEELTINDWETLTTRATGRAANAPFSIVIGDCNPSKASHWILQRKSIDRRDTYHSDNPTLYTANGELTARGIKALAVLNNLTGVRKLRLADGKWVNAEGAVYSDYDSNIHLIDRFDIPNAWRRIIAIDFGYTNPFVASWYAIDNDDRLYRYREIYQTQSLVEDMAREIIALSQGENIEAVICDHDAEDRATLLKHGIPNVKAYKAIKNGIEAVQLRLRKTGDGKPRVYFLRDSLIRTDESLRDRHLPTCTEEEIDGYEYPPGLDGKPVKEIPIDKDNHGLDTLRYAVCYVDNIGIELQDSVQMVIYDQRYEISPY